MPSLISSLSLNNSSFISFLNSSWAYDLSYSSCNFYSTIVPTVYWQTPILTLNFSNCLRFLSKSTYSSTGTLYTNIYINAPKCTNIELRAFQSAGNLISINFPSCSTQIEGYAFTNCKQLQTVEMPNCKIIPSGCFYSCNSLQSITFSPLCSLILDYAF